MSAPDFAAPVLGFRAWHAHAAGELVPWSAAAAGPWAVGVNQARCLQEDIADHVPPGRACSCGLYALGDVRDRRLLPRDQAVGAVAGWGEVEVHRTGWRAQFACVLGLGVPERCPAEHLVRLQAAAARYGVELVPLGELPELALQYARPLVFEALPVGRPVRAPRNPGPSLVGNGGLRGIAVEEHVWVEVRGSRLVVGLTAALAGEVEIGSPVSVAAGAPLARGDRLARVGVGDAELRVEAPFGAREVEANEAVVRDPDLVRVDAEGEGWIARLVPSAWADEGGWVTWGAAATRVYASWLARERPDPFLGARARWLRAHAHVASAADVLAELRAARERGRFSSVAEARRRVVVRLERAVAAVRERLLRADALITWRLHDPELDVVLDLRAAEGAGRELVLHASAETADDYFCGRVDLAAALRAGVVQTSAPIADVLAVESVIKSLHGAYRAAAP